MLGTSFFQLEMAFPEMSREKSFDSIIEIRIKEEVERGDTFSISPGIKVSKYE